MDGGPLIPRVEIDFKFVIVAIVLGLLVIIVICGNCLVIAAVFTSPKLRSVTNLFIASLATSDLLLGILVLPTSSTVEILPYWAFGDLWCSMWLAIDVWMCTSQILNLCAISFDRWIAIQYPMKYPSLMSPKRGKILIACCWIVSFIVCFPPLIGWNEKGQSVADTLEQYYSTTSPPDKNEVDFNYSMFAFQNESYDFYVDIFNVTEVSRNVTKNASLPTCELTSDPGYIVYSACGSFFLPCCVMLFFYFKIYRAAHKFTQSLRRGVISSKGFSSKGLNHATSGDSDNVTMRVHRGGGASTKCKTLESRPKSTNWGDDLHVTANGRGGSLRAHRFKERPASLVFCRAQSTSFDLPQISPSTSSNISPNDSPNLTHNGGKFAFRDKRAKALNTRLGRRDLERSNENSPSSLHVYEKPAPENNNGKVKRVTSPRRIIFSFISKHASSDHHDRPIIRRHNRETKAAKTVAIIICAFIVCWAPFFTYYLITGICKDCRAPDELFKVIFWLGYCNSAVNPCIYALCSRDYRHAFKKLIHCKLRTRWRKNGGRATYITSLRLKTDSDLDRHSS